MLKPLFKTPFQSNTPLSTLVEPPVSLRIEHLSHVSKEDALEYATGYLKSSMNSSRLFYGVFAFGSGFIVELHEGGSGKAFTPSILNAIQQYPERDFNSAPLKAVIPSGKGNLFISVKSDTLSALELPQGRFIDVDLQATLSEHSLIRAQFRHSRRLLSASAALLSLSMMVFLWASYSSLDVPTLIVDRVAAHETALAHWNSTLAWPDSELPHTATFANGKWSVATEPVQILNSKLPF